MHDKGGGSAFSGTSVGLIFGALMVILAVTVCYRYSTCQSARDMRKLREDSCISSADIVADEQHEKHQKAPHTPRLLMQMPGPRRPRHKKLVDERSLTCHDDVADTHTEVVELERNTVELGVDAASTRSNTEEGDATSPSRGERKEGANEHL